MALKNSCSVTFDFSQKGPDYAVVTLHYINDEWQSMSQILDFVPFPLLESAFNGDIDDNTPSSKTIENVREFLNSILLENGWTAEEIKEVIVVTDEARNISFGKSLIFYILI